MDPTPSEGTAGSGFTYDQIPYRGAAEPFINLRTLEVVARLSGLSVPDIASCRVLELGCADGANVLPSALEFPESKFVGVDLAVDAIRQANDLATELAIPNAEFQNASVSEIDPSIGNFDYILCPGVFSWVSDDERAGIMRVCRDHLSPDGIAVISYNVLPGWNGDASLREFALLQVAGIEDPQRRIAEVRNAVEFLAANTNASSAMASFFAATRDHLRTRDDAYVYHEYLAKHNQGFYFHQFAEMAKNHDLKFHCEADFKHTSGFGLDGPARTALSYASAETREQAYDFLVNAKARRSVLCRIDRESQPVAQDALLTGLSIALGESFEQWSLDPADPQPATLPFRNGNVTISDVLLKAALRGLMDCWPASSPFDDLHERSCAMLGWQPNENSLASLANSLLAIYSAGLIRVFQTPPKLSAGISDRPQVSSLARATAKLGLEVVNQWHENTPGLGAEERFILSQLDGTHTIEQLRLTLQDFRATHGVTQANPDIQDLLRMFFKARLLIA